MSGIRIKMHPGRLLAEPGAATRWRAEERIAEGRSFELWLVDDLHLEGHRAVAKVIRYANESAEHVQARRRLLDDERDLYVLPATIIPEPLDWLMVDDEPVLLYEHQLGETLSSLIRSRYPSGVGEARAARLTRELAHFAGEIHEAGFVLRDLCGDHVLLGLDDVIQVIGFGNAAPIGAPRSEERHKRSVTDEFSAPEAIAGGRLEPAADSWSLGTVLAYLATGAPRGPVPGPLGDLVASCRSEQPRSRPSAQRIYESLQRFEAARRRASAAAPSPRPAKPRAPAPPARKEEKKPAPAPEKATPAKAAKPPPPDKPVKAGKPWKPGPMFWVILTLALAGGAAALVYFLRGGG